MRIIIGIKGLLVHLGILYSEYNSIILLIRHRATTATTATPRSSGPPMPTPTATAANLLSPDQWNTKWNNAAALNAAAGKFGYMG